ncbi:MAG: class I SAM-dependent methyltransferase [Vicinamibacteria bacterium]
MSLEKLEEHRRLWSRKPVLALVYRVWFESLLGAISTSGRILEVGAGPGFLAEFARRSRAARWIATDVLEAPWNDLVADALRLPARDGTIDAVVGLDVIHHLAEPERFFEEAARVLAPGGRLAVVEPWITPFSYPIYRFLHQEGCDTRLDPWHPFGNGSAKEAFDGDGGVFTGLVRSLPADGWRRFGFGPPRLTLMNGFAYLLSLGFREGSLLPRAATPLFLALDRHLDALSRVFALRALCVWERSGIISARPEQ